MDKRADKEAVKQPTASMDPTGEPGSPATPAPQPPSAPPSTTLRQPLWRPCGLPPWGEP
jgi:hypothetical protein